MAAGPYPPARPPQPYPSHPAPQQQQQYGYRPQVPQQHAPQQVYRPTQQSAQRAAPAGQQSEQQINPNAIIVSRRQVRAGAGRAARTPERAAPGCGSCWHHEAGSVCQWALASCSLPASHCPHARLNSPALQEGNPLLKHIRNVRWQFDNSLVPDYMVGREAAVLFISLRCEVVGGACMVVVCV